MIPCCMVPCLLGCSALGSISQPTWSGHAGFHPGGCQGGLAVCPVGRAPAAIGLPSGDVPILQHPPCCPCAASLISGLTEPCGWSKCLLTLCGAEGGRCCRAAAAPVASGAGGISSQSFRAIAFLLVFA